MHLHISKCFAHSFSTSTTTIVLKPTSVSFFFKRCQGDDQWERRPKETVVQQREQKS